MTVTLTRVIQRFIGLSTDTKPTDVPIGSTFWEYNTRRLFETGDGTNWTTATDPNAGIAFYAPLDGSLIDHATGVDGTHVRASSATYIDDNGIIQTAGANIPRFEFVDGRRAILLEPAGTNLCEDSEVFRVGISGWLNQNCTVTDNVVAAPDGNATADKIVEANDVGQSHYVSNTIAKESFTDNTSVTFSVYLKPAGRTFARIRFRRKDGNYREAYFNLSTGAMSGTADADSYGSEQVGSSGWWRYWITSDITNGPNDPMFFVYLAEADNDVTYNGDGTSGVHIWGAQVEQFPVPTSYIVTSGAPATRTTESGHPYWTLPLGLFDAEGICSVWVRFGYAAFAPAADIYSGIIATKNAHDSLLRNKMDDGGIHQVQTIDGLNIAIVNLSWLAKTWYKLDVEWSSTTLKIRVGYDIGVGIVWGSEAAFDGSYTLGDYLRLAFDLFGPMYMAEVLAKRPE